MEVDCFFSDNKRINASFQSNTVIDGEDGVGVKTARVDENGHLIVVLTDGTVIDAGVVKGVDGVSPTITVYAQSEDTYQLKITTADGTFITPNLKGEDGGLGNVTIGDNLQIENNVLSVKTTDDAEGDNTLPITSSGVKKIVGNIEKFEYYDTIEEANLRDGVITFIAEEVQ